MASIQEEASVQAKKKDVKAYFVEDRYKKEISSDQDFKVAKWRMMKGRMKTVSVGLVLALNIGVDPPDVIKTSPCARTECWFDPRSQPPNKSVEAIAKALQAQYERWQPRARYKAVLDPTLDDVKKLCASLRRSSKNERVLFHYNGHGVPRPTDNGELWVFNKNFSSTSIPLSIYDLQSWLGNPAIYVFDCSAAGLVVKWFLEFAKQREQEHERLSKSGTTTHLPALMTDCILLAACQADELLPMNPDLPADLFVSCLTTPIKTALKWYCSHSLLDGVTAEMIDRIPGRLSDRRTPLGELNWIFTAITDTIAWNVLPAPLFQRLFRQDLLVASLMRNFLLAERIMRSHNCTPISHPSLPPTYQHPLWHAWDLAADVCLSQLPVILKEPKKFQSNPFFADQLSAFEVWLEFGSDKKKPPEQLPIVLQVLLSKAHRLKALKLLAKFLDLGHWAVNLALSVGIFPYILKLLQSAATELRDVLIFIWTKILALDKSCQIDLIKDGGQQYSIQVLASASNPNHQRTMAAFILSVIMSGCRPGQSACLTGKLMTICLNQLSQSDAKLKLWCVLCLAKLWEDYEEAKEMAAREQAPKKLCLLLGDVDPEVRTACVYALGTFIGTSPPDSEPAPSKGPTAGSAANVAQIQAKQRLRSRAKINLNLGLTLPVIVGDSNPMARKELTISLGKLILCYEAAFLDAILSITRDETSHVASEAEAASRKSLRSSANSVKTASPARSPSRSGGSQIGAGAHRSSSRPLTNQPGSVYAYLWKVLLALCKDPVEEVAKVAKHLLRFVYLKIAKLTKTGGGAVHKHVVKKLAELLAVGSATASPAPGRRKMAKTPTRSKGKSALDQCRSQVAQLLARSDAEDLAEIQAILVSRFYDWNCASFSRPSMRTDPLEDPTTPEALECEWRSKLETSFLEHTVATRAKAACRKFETQIAILDNQGEMASLLALHPSEPLCVVTDDRSLIHVWNWRDHSGLKLHSFSNTDSPGRFISAIALINTHQRSMLVTGSDTGIVRVWKNFDSQQELVTAFRSFSDLRPSPRQTRGAGLVFDWWQSEGLLATSGDVSVIRIWDVERGLYTQDIPVGDNGCITSLAHHPDSRILLASSSDGALRVFDGRTPSFKPAQTLSGHRAWVLKAAIPSLGTSQVVSGDVSGVVKIWDLRHQQALRTISAHRGDMTSFTVHSHAEIFATGTQNQKVRIANFEGKELSSIRYHDGFLGQRIGPVSCLEFHPYKLILAAGATDSIISMYQSSVV
eukprot:CAMPEP_0114607422 /NCGR_PEP_ID=MMETSP0168-20121206/2061_1 /TAXON_ID=95228 ORGANISM="Vannella sp., Strain DIVA3 517/6/12" /NCGR_SAMPLE_ID=MMETSP0168 /ASSEMBLY_ACC=CAM_ASM_000044 /LENGTH=1255 /DNA_ID=CAMNT_0001818301 /DNA_START=266 /DNA_END=4034 /DNA_ORIENTATION=+